MTESTSSTSQSPHPENSSPENSSTTLIVVVCIGGFIITASIIVIIVVAVFVRKSTRELRQQTRSDHNRSRGPRPAHASSIRMTQGQRVEVVRARSIVQGGPQQEQKDPEKEPRTQEEIQGYYAVIPRSEDLTTSPDEPGEPGERGILYAALDFDDETGKPGKVSEDTGSQRLTGPSIALPYSQPDTYVEMEALVASIINNSDHVQSIPATYALAKVPDLEVQDPSRGISGDQIRTDVDNKVVAGNPGGELLVHPVVHPL